MPAWLALVGGVREGQVEVSTGTVSTTVRVTRVCLEVRYSSIALFGFRPVHCIGRIR